MNAIMPRNEVLWFAEEMEKKLRANDHKGHWSNCTPVYLYNRADNELKEVWTALLGDGSLNPCTPEEAARIIAECADVANFMMMLADNASRFLNPPPEAPSDG